MKKKVRFVAGTIVRDYRLEQMLGAPGQDGEVWKAVKIKKRVSTPYAIKFLHNKTTDGRTRFRNEIQRLGDGKGRLQHIVKIHDEGSYRGSPYFVMDFISEAAPATDVLQQTGTTAKDVLEMLRQAALGLQELHKQLQLNHTDIKGKNLLVSRGIDPVLFITDFGFVQKRGGHLSASRRWVKSSHHPEFTLEVDSLDVWQLAQTFRGIVKDSNISGRAWLLDVFDAIAPSEPINHRLRTLLPEQILAMLESINADDLSQLPRWEPLSPDAAASLVQKAYEYTEQRPTKSRLVTLLNDWRVPPIDDSPEKIIKSINVMQVLENPNAFRNSEGYVASDLKLDGPIKTPVAAEIAKRIVFGVPFNIAAQSKAPLEWEALYHLVTDLPTSYSNYLELDDQHARAFLRYKERVQVSLWDASIPFLGLGRDSHVFFVSGFDAFVIAKTPLGVLQRAARQGLSRGATYWFIVPPASTEAKRSAEEFRRNNSEFADRIRILQVRCAHDLSPTKKNTDRRIPETMARGQYFTPGFRFVLFLNVGGRNPGALFVGLPSRTGTSGEPELGELFAFRYGMQDNLTQEFLQWLSRTLPKKQLEAVAHLDSVVATT